MYSFFVIITGCMSIYIAGLIFWDIWSSLWPTCLAEITRLDYIRVDRGGKADKWYNAALTYRYEIKGEVYVSNGVNVFGNVIRRNKLAVVDIVEGVKSGGNIRVHVCPINHKISYAFPLKGSLIIMVFYLWITFWVLFCSVQYNYYLHGYYFFE